MSDPIKIHGRAYPFWSQFVQDPCWIGGELQDLDPDSGMATTTIKAVTLEANGPESAMFSVEGDNWGCSSDVRYLGVLATMLEEDKAGGWIRFIGYGGHQWRIRSKESRKLQEEVKSLCA
jgi:hypothetical protein